ncbi:hypothetical protein ACXM0N_16780 [Peribacillus simplex]
MNQLLQRQVVLIITNAAIVPYPVKVNKIGSKGKDIGRIQRALKIKADDRDIK